MNARSLFEPENLGSKSDAAPAATRASVSNHKFHHEYMPKTQSPPAHHSAPKGTSSVAAEMNEPLSTSRRELVQRKIKDTGSNGLTDEEGATALGLNAQSYTPRRNEIVKKGLVVNSWLRRPTRSTRPAAVWVLASLHQRHDGMRS